MSRHTATSRAGAGVHPRCETLQLHAGPGNGHEEHAHGAEELLQRSLHALARTRRRLARWLGSDRQII